ncbi:hypothetical protein C8Q76DRAFT_623198, partial [Earliella scabrosa]
FSCFQLQLGHAPCLISPLLNGNVLALSDELGDDVQHIAEIITQIDMDVMKVQNNLLMAKLIQAEQVNCTRTPNPCYIVGDLVLLSMFHHCCQYIQRSDNCVAKFMVQYDGSYCILNAHPTSSSYTLNFCMINREYVFIGSKHN